MSVKWQKATDEYMKFHKMNPIFGTQKPLVFLKMDKWFDFKHYIINFTGISKNL